MHCNCKHVTVFQSQYSITRNIRVINLLPFVFYLKLLICAQFLSCRTINYWTCYQWGYYICTTQFKENWMLWTKWMWLQIFHAKELLNILKPSGFFTFHQVEQSKILHGVHFALSVLWGSQNGQRLLLYTSLTGFYNRGGKSLLRGTDWFLMQSRLRLVFKRLIFFLLGDSLASEFYMPTFQETLPHIHRWCKQEE